MVSTESNNVFYKDITVLFKLMPCDRILSIKEPIYQRIISLKNDELLIPKIDQNSPYISDEELIILVNNFNNGLKGSQKITILEFLTISNHYRFDGGVDRIQV
jgi:hypothetical protein